MTKPFESSCPACGSPDNTAKYTYKGDSIPYRSDGLQPNKYSTTSGDRGWHATQDYIQMRCGFCMFKWVEDPLHL